VIVVSLVISASPLSCPSPGASYNCYSRKMHRNRTGAWDIDHMRRYVIS